jgi:hypothetical protein
MIERNQLELNAAVVLVRSALIGKHVFLSLSVRMHLSLR